MDFFEKVGYCSEAADWVCETSRFVVANYGASAILSQFFVGIDSGKGLYTLSTVDFGGIYNDDGFVLSGIFFVGTVIAVIGGFVEKRLLCGGS